MTPHQVPKVGDLTVLLGLNATETVDGVAVATGGLWSRRIRGSNTVVIEVVQRVVSARYIVASPEFQAKLATALRVALN